MMDNNNWRPAPPGVGGAGEQPAPDGDDWRKLLPLESRQRIVNKIMEPLKRHLPFSGPEGLHEQKKMAVRFEEKIFHAASNQPDYLQKISVKMLTMENKSQNSAANAAMPTGSAGNSSKHPDPVPLDSAAQGGQANGVDWQEEIYQKIKSLKDSYWQDLNEMYQKIATKLQQHDSLPQQPKSEQLEKLKIFKALLKRLIAMLQVPKSEIHPSLKDKLPLYEKQILNFMNTNRPRRPQGQLPPHHMPSMQPQPSQPQVGQGQSNENQMNPQMQSMNIQGSGASMQQNNMNSMQHNSMSSFPGVSNSQPMMNSLQPNANIESGQGNAMNSLQEPECCTSLIM